MESHRFLSLYRLGRATTRLATGIPCGRVSEIRTKLQKQWKTAESTISFDTNASVHWKHWFVNLILVSVRNTEWNVLV